MWVLIVLEDNNIDKMLKSLDATVSININKISCGLWDQDTPIVVIKRGLEDIDRFLASSYFRRHSNIRILSAESRVWGGRPVLDQAVYRLWDRTWQFSLIDGERNTEMLVPRKSFDLENYEEWFNLPILIVVFTTVVVQDKADVLPQQHSQCEHVHRRERTGEAVRDHAQGGAAAVLQSRGLVLPPAPGRQTVGSN